MKRKSTLILTALFISIGFWQLLETPIYSQSKALTLVQVKNSLTVSNDKKRVEENKKIEMENIIISQSEEILSLRQEIQNLESLLLSQVSQPFGGDNSITHRNNNDINNSDDDDDNNDNYCNNKYGNNSNYNPFPQGIQLRASFF